MTNPTAPTAPAAPAAPPAPPAPSGPGNSGQPQTIAELDEKIDAVIDTLRGLIGQGHSQAQQHTAARLDRGSSVEDTVRAELARLQAERERKAAEQGRDDTIKSHAAQLAEVKAKLTEAPPETPVSWLTRAIWGSPAKQAAK
jgi:hypothetical protein